MSYFKDYLAMAEDSYDDFTEPSMHALTLATIDIAKTLRAILDELVEEDDD